MMKCFVVLPLIALVLLLGKCSVVHFEHDASAQKLLAALRCLPLPSDARLVYEQYEVGNCLSSTGDATDVLGYRVFVSDLPIRNISDFFAPFVKQAKAFDLGVRKLDAPQISPYFYMKSIVDHVPEADRNRAYILYAVDRCEKDGLWDVRGW